MRPSLSIGKRCQQLKPPAAPPLLRVRISVPGQPDRFITDPRAVDKAAIDAWAKVHKGNIGEKAADSAILGFMSAFGDFFPHADPMPLEPITGEQVRLGIAASPDNTAGLDGVQKGDLAILSPYACDWIAALLNSIEAGAAWPDLCTQGRLAFLSKGGDAASPLDFRKLSILSKVYRLHMTLRLKDLAPWIKSWALACLFAGTCDPAGAEDAWYETALLLELSKLEGTPFSGGGADIFKCFDQIVRVLLLDLLVAGGFPPRLARAYKKIHLKLHYRNTVAGGLGEIHWHLCGIPQGCPLSMTCIAFLLCPWARAVTAARCIPRALADDITVFAIGQGHELLLERGYHITLLYLSIPTAPCK